MTVLLSEYPPEVLKQLAHPVQGIVRSCKFLPTMAELGDLADELLIQLGQPARDAEGELYRLQHEQALLEQRRRDEAWTPDPKVAAGLQKLARDMRTNTTADLSGSGLRPNDRRNGGVDTRSTSDAKASAAKPS